MHIVRSHRMERLAEALADALRQPQADPFAAELLVVPSDGLAQWAAMEVARRNGVAARLTFLHPRAAIERLILAALGEAAPSAEAVAAWAPDRLVWRLMVDAPEVAADPRFGALASALPAEVEQRFLFCHQLARTFSQYPVFRPELVLGWEQGQEAGDWQAELWRRLVGALGPDHHARLALRASRALERGEVAGGGEVELPERISFLGVASLPPLWLRVLAALRERVEVWFYQLAPTEGLLERGQDHPLLSRLGAVARDLQHLLLEVDGLVESEEDRFEEDEDGGALADRRSPFEHGGGRPADPREPGAAGGDDPDAWGHAHPSEGAPAPLLHQLQRDLLDQRAPDPQGEGLRPFAADDRSLVVYGCHAPIREVEVVRDLLRGMFEADPTLRPRDVVVMTPDVAVHGPLFEAVFGVDPSDPLYIPWRLADRAALHDNPVAGAILELIRLVRARCTATELLDLLRHAPLRERYGFAAEDATTLAALVDAAGVRWGRDAAHRAAWGQPEQDDGTWRAGLDRLCMGALVDGLRPALGVVPVADLDGDLAALAMRLLAFAGDVLRAVDALSHELPAQAHVATLRSLLEAWFGGDAPRAANAAELDGPVRAVRAQLDTIDAGCASLAEPVPASLIARMLELALGEERRSGGFLRGGVTVCEMLPMRAVPFRVVCVVGMSDGLFPRNDLAPSWDRTRDPRLRGDRSRREDDRAMWLDALLSARERLVITAVTRSVADDSPLPPSVLLDELLDLLEVSFVCADGRSARQALVASMPLQPFSTAYATPGGPVTWDRAAARGAAALMVTPAERPRIGEPVPELHPGPIDVRSLLRFVRDPSAWFFRRRLGLTEADGAGALPEREPVVVDALERWAVRDRTLQLWRSGLSGPERARVLRAEGRVGPGALGALPIGDAEACLGRVVAAAAPWRARPVAAPRVVDLELGGALGPGGAPWRIVGRLDDLREGAQLVWTASSVSRDAGRHWLPAWARHLVYHADRSDGAPPAETVLIGVDGAAWVWRPIDVDAAREALATWLGWLRVAQSRPVVCTADMATAWWLALQAAAPEGALERADRAAVSAISASPDVDERSRALAAWAERFGDPPLGADRAAGETPDVEGIARACVAPALAAVEIVRAGAGEEA